MDRILLKTDSSTLFIGNWTNEKVPESVNLPSVIIRWADEGSPQWHGAAGAEFPPCWSFLGQLLDVTADGSVAMMDEATS